MIKRRLTIKWFRPMMARCAKVKALQKSSKTWVHSGCTNNKPSASGWGFFIGSPRVLVQTPVRQNAKRFGRRRRSAGLVIRRQSDNNQSLPVHALNTSRTLSLRLGVFYWPTQSIGSNPCSTKRKAFWTPKAVLRVHHF
jgi:hypothetical protein